MIVLAENDDATRTVLAHSLQRNRRDVQSNQTLYSTSSCEGIGVYAPLQTARVSANNVKRLLQQWTDAEVPGRAILIARATAYEAWSQFLLAEGFCTTVFSTVAGGVFDYGPEITRQAALGTAETTFSEAITAAQAAGGASADSIPSSWASPTVSSHSMSSGLRHSRK